MINDTIQNNQETLQHLNQYQLAQRWNISQSTLERWRFLRRGPKFLKIGARVVYRLTEIEACEVENMCEGTPASLVAVPGFTR